MPTIDGLSNEWDAIVLGAGPAGSAAAISIARQGVRVLLIDSKRFPRRKVCGGCLNRISTGLLGNLIGTDHPLWTRALPLDSFQLRHSGRGFQFSMPSGWAVDRAEMDQSLVESAQRSGATFCDQTSGKLLHADANWRMVEVVQGSHTRILKARVVILASGLASRAAGAHPELLHTASPRSRVGIEAIFDRYPEQYASRSIHMVVGREGYVGLTQIAGKRLHVAAAVDRAALQRSGLAELTRSILSQAGAAELNAEPLDGWRGTPPLTSRANCLSSERVFLVGDAAGYIEPFTGEGIRWALETGMGIAPFVSDSLHHWDPQLGDGWDRWYTKNIVREQRLCRHISSGLKHSLIRWLAHQTICIQPRVADGIIARLNQESTR